jgi:hypothetical protein
MSATRTHTQTTTDPTNLRDLLRTYDTHLTGFADDEGRSNSSSEQQQQPQRTQAEEPASASTPPRDWPSDWHGIPPYREASRHHRVADRAAGVDNAEGVMVMVMFTGVWLQGVSR